MWDEEQDKEVMRNQMRAIVVMGVLVFAWFYFFPVQTVVQPPPVDTAEEPAPFNQAGIPPFTDGTPAPIRDLPPESLPAPGSLTLPPVADDLDSEFDYVTIHDELMVLTFTKIGARLKEAELRLGEDGKDSIQVVPSSPGVADTQTEYPFGLNFSDPQIQNVLDIRRFEVEVDSDGKGVTFTLEVPGEFTLRKTFSLTGNPHVVRVAIEYENHSAAPRVIGKDETPAYIFNWAPNLITDEDSFRPMTQFIWRSEVDGQIQNETLLPSDIAIGARELVPRVRWVGYKTKYFMVAMKPEGDVETTADAWLEGSENHFRLGLASPRFEVGPGEKHEDIFELYIGPMELASLDAAWPSLSSSLTFFTMFNWMDSFAKMLLSLMHWFHDHTIANWGIAIILMTVLVRAVMLPLTIKSTRSMKKMQALAPEMEVLRGKYKEDQQELSRKTMEMYRERGVNPMGGCFPMLIQMPVFIALYRMLWNAYEMRGAPFMWVEDLSKPDHFLEMPFMKGIPLIGEYLAYLNILPILMGVAMVLNMKIMPQAGMQNPQQKMIMNIMPVMFAVFCYPLAAGLNLYVLTSTILGMAQQALVRGVTPEVTAESIEKEKKAKAKTKPKKRGNFYDNAMAKKKEMEKEAKRAKKQQLADKRDQSNGGAKNKKSNKGKNKQSAKHGKKNQK
jgi:YidC/Oxa1 family membrane protein insertase